LTQPIRAGAADPNRRRCPAVTHAQLMPRRRGGHFPGKATEGRSSTPVPDRSAGKGAGPPGCPVRSSWCLTEAARVAIPTHRSSRASCSD